MLSAVQWDIMQYVGSLITTSTRTDFSNLVTASYDTNICCQWNTPAAGVCERSNTDEPCYLLAGTRLVL